MGQPVPDGDHQQPLPDWEGRLRQPRLLGHLGHLDQVLQDISSGPPQLLRDTDKTGKCIIIDLGVRIK